MEVLTSKPAQPVVAYHRHTITVTCSEQFCLHPHVWHITDPVNAPGPLVGSRFPCENCGQTLFVNSDAVA